MLGNCCCCPIIGFDESAWSGVTQCCAGMNPITDLKSNIGRLGECRVVFAGNNNQCGNAVRFAAGDWPAVKTYINNGGRFWLQAEYGPVGGGDGPAGGCLQDAVNLRSFLTAIGSAVIWLGDQYDGFCATNGTRDCIPSTANIAQGLASPFRMALTSELSGGVTVVWKSPSGKDMVMVEKLGNGFLFVAGDSNLSGGCGYDNCAFFKRLWEYVDGQIL